MGEHNVLAPAHGSSVHAVELGDGVAVLVFPPGGFEVAGDGPLEGFASQVADQVCPVGLVGPGGNQGGGARVEAGDDQPRSIPRRLGDCGVWIVSGGLSQKVV
ncbi:hypothetical protein L2137_11525 [Corynebacterium diphtheriae bv. mitis]|uniref:hypothetical protein n=1 Tax=Corynebacterium diphtheriae TaxID=1717 RepID=UPI00202BACCB|nr:hypothetical protein [Corynebacterium diphtheriae]MCM0170441.1 hypothetical protein [Corynebacterium diphtheriae bv. mitis]